MEKGVKHMTPELPTTNQPDNNNQEAIIRITPNGKEEYERWKRYAMNKISRGEVPDLHWRSSKYKKTHTQSL